MRPERVADTGSFPYWMLKLRGPTPPEPPALTCRCGLFGISAPPTVARSRQSFARRRAATGAHRYRVTCRHGAQLRISAVTMARGRDFAVADVAVVGADFDIAPIERCRVEPRSIDLTVRPTAAAARPDCCLYI